ncbi:MAG: LysR family transcriptional regulator [Myxococcales bacterium]|nr:LysR family transcriptional regulator [Myxococcales bacterium]
MRFTHFSFTLRQLQYALAVRELRGFGKAAERCFVSQPSLSAQIAELEGAIGVSLFDRDQRPVVPTADGERWLAQAEALLRSADGLDGLARQFGDPLGGTIRLGIIPSVAPYLLPTATPVLRERLPRLSVQWIEEKTEVLVTKIQRGELDGAVLALEARLDGLESVGFARDPFLFVCAASDMSHCNGLGTTVQLEQVDPASLLLLDEGHCLRDQVVAACGSSSADRDFRATSLATLVQMVSAGLGVTLLPKLCVKAETARASLTVRVAEPEPFRTLGLAWRHGTTRTPGLWDALRGAFAVAAERAMACAPDAA